MNSKVVFLDIDGTLVNKKGEIPASAREAISRAKANGHKMVLCSGRSMFQVYPELLELGFDGIVGAAGAFVIADGKEIYHAYIDAEHRRQVCAYLNRHNIIYCFQRSTGVVTDQENWERMIAFQKKKGMDPKVMERLAGEVCITETPWEEEGSEKIIYYDAPYSIERVHWDLLPYFDAVALSLEGADSYSGEIGINHIHKATGMEIYLNYVGIDREETIGIGDGPNDLQMMSYSGIGVAMGNARDEVKALADRVTTNIDDDGIYHIFQWLELI